MWSSLEPIENFSQSLVSVKIEANPVNGQAPLTVKFGALSKIAPRLLCDKPAYSWDFDDGTTSDSSSSLFASHEFVRAGHYRVTVVYTLAYAEGKNCDKQLRVTASDFVMINVREPPQACFTFSPKEPKIGDIVTFDAQCSSDADGKIIRYEWDFGDGSRPQLGIQASHQYRSFAIFRVRLHIEDDHGGCGRTEDFRLCQVVFCKLDSKIGSGLGRNQLLRLQLRPLC
ncbi:PKD domain-containing protein [Candidatus Acetothermia bacterium]|nr:PKD domain-containing protein [Candidatus Acetothermia bacterium]